MWMRVTVGIGDFWLAGMWRANDIDAGLSDPSVRGWSKKPEQYCWELQRTKPHDFCATIP